MSSHHRRCDVCWSKKRDDVRLGQFLEYKFYAAHHFCLLLSNDFHQRGKDNGGILGFLLDDIRKGLKITENEICFYCNKTGASICCASRKCSRKFHLPCGAAAGASSKFLGQYDTFCEKHNQEYKVVNFCGRVCVICSEKLGMTKMAIETNCCHGVFHRRCLGQMALSAGYFFKCPLCNEKDPFRQNMRIRGIFIPDRDAAWELEPNAFNELVDLNRTCESSVCYCDHGRKFGTKKWPFQLCDYCGVSAIHSRCLRNSNLQKFICDLCGDLRRRKTSKVENTVTEEETIPETPPAKRRRIEKDVIDSIGAYSASSSSVDSCLSSSFRRISNFELSGLSSSNILGTKRRQRSQWCQEQHGRTPLRVSTRRKSCVYPFSGEY